MHLFSFACYLLLHLFICPYDIRAIKCWGIQTQKRVLMHTVAQRHVEFIHERVQSSFIFLVYKDLFVIISACGISSPRSV